MPLRPPKSQSATRTITTKPRTPPKSGPAVAAVSVITAAAAEQQDQYNNDKSCTHDQVSRQVLTAPAAPGACIICSTHLAPRPSGLRRRSESCLRPCPPCRRPAAWRRLSPCQSPPSLRPWPLSRRLRSCLCPWLYSPRALEAMRRTFQTFHTLEFRNRDHSGLGSPTSGSENTYSRPKSKTHRLRLKVGQI